jgi:alcohol dehydrogenase
MDALGHAIDSYTNVNFNPFSDAIDLQVMRLLAEYLPVAVSKGNNLTARSAVMFAASSAGFGFSQRGTALTHGISHPLGVYGNLPHGLTISLLLPYVMEYNLDACAPKLADVAEAMGQRIDGLSTRDAALKAVEAVRTLTRSIDMPQRLSDAGVREDVLPAIAKDTVTQRRGNIAINPRDANEEQVLALLRRAF